MTGSLATHAAFGLRIASDLALPEMARVEAGEADVVVRAGAVPDDGAGVGEQIGPFSFASGNALWLHVPGVARFLIREGREILYAAEPGVDEDSVRVFLLGTCFGTLLLQRGMLVLHGNAFMLEGGCAVCVGPSGAGKSTLAARMWQRGAGVVADDVVPVDASGSAVPGLPRIKLWQDTADALGIDTSGLRRIRPQMPKYDLPLGDAFHARPAPVRAIYTLAPWNRESFALEDVTGAAKFAALHANGYRPRFMEGMGLGQQHMRQAAALGAQVPVVEVRRPRLGFDLDGLADAIGTDFAARTAPS